MKAHEVTEKIRARLNYKYSTWSRMTPAGIEIGINKPEGGSLASLLPIGDETRESFVDFMVKEFRTKVLNQTQV